MEDSNVQKDMEKITELKNQIMMQCPVHKINLSIETPQAIAGMYILGQLDPKPMIKEAADLSDLTDDTILFFNDRHKSEVCQIIYGMLSILKEQGKIDTNGAIEFVSFIVSLSPCTYKVLKDTVEDLVRRNISGVSDLILTNILYAIDNIWFVPYNKIDEMAQEAINEFQTAMNGGEYE
jgi:hypothetical protein